MADKETRADWGDGYRDMLYTLAESGLAAPPIPSRLRPRLERRAPWCWATRDIDPMSMYRFNEYIEELSTEKVADYVAVSHAGHGINSYGLNYHLVSGRAAVFTQDGWGGGYMDAVAARAEVAATFSGVFEFLNSGAPADDPERSPRVVLTWSRSRGVCAAGVQSRDGDAVEMIKLEDRAEMFARGATWAELPEKERRANWLAEHCESVREARFGAPHGSDSLVASEPTPSDGAVAALDWRSKYLDAFISEMQRINREMNE